MLGLCIDSMKQPLATFEQINEFISLFMYYAILRSTAGW